MAEPAIPRKRRTRRRLRTVSVLRLGFLLALYGASFGAAALYLAVQTINDELPGDLQQLLDYQPNRKSVVLSSDGEEIGAFSIENRRIVALDRMPPHVPAAFLSAEDRRFYKHKGFDLLGIVRAAVTNFRSDGNIKQGGSTITQQIIKQTLLAGEEQVGALDLTPAEYARERKARKYRRKAKEVILAVRLERELTKAEILSIYLNHVYLGHGAYGVGAAAETYFGKEVEDLTIAEAAMLGGLVASPTRYAPHRNMQLARERQRYVLGHMRDDQYISNAEYEAALAEPIALVDEQRPQPPGVAVLRRARPPARDPALRQPRPVPRRPRVLLDARHPDAGRGRERAAPRPGGARPQARVPRADRRGRARRARRLDRRARPPDQRPDRRHHRGRRSGPARAGVRRHGRRPAAHRRRRHRRSRPPADGADRRRRARRPRVPRCRRPASRSGSAICCRSGCRPDGNQVALAQRPALQGSFIAMEPTTGRVLAMVGGYDWTASQFDRATQARRQVGSSIKPFIYSAALEAGRTPVDHLVDGPFSVTTATGVWTPANYDNKYLGDVTLMTALAYSLNTISVQLAVAVGIDRIIEIMRGYGITSPIPRHISISLGTPDLTPLEVATGYAGIASGGRRITPRFFDLVTDTAGNVVEDLRTQPPGPQVVSPDVDYVIINLMKGVVARGTARWAAQLGRPIAGKTGTSANYRDVWFNGFTTDLLGSVWIGRDDSTPIGDKITGGGAAVPIWLDFMQKAHPRTPVRDFPVPANVSFARVEPWSGDPTGPSSEAVWMPFVRGTLPGKFLAGPGDPLVRRPGAGAGPAGASAVMYGACAPRPRTALDGDRRGAVRCDRCPGCAAGAPGCAATRARFPSCFALSRSPACCSAAGSRWRTTTRRSRAPTPAAARTAGRAS